MDNEPSRFQLTRRRFAFWVGLGLFNLSEALGADSLDRLAALSMRATETSPAGGKNSRADDRPTLSDKAQSDKGYRPEHWTSAENNTWRWFERENLILGRWKLTGITTPINKLTGEPFTGRTGYLSESLVPANVRQAAMWGERPEHEDVDGDVTADVNAGAIEDDPGVPSAWRRARHGRPPSRWLRSLHADELRIWLGTIDPPEAGVSGMTFWEHLTRDHSFDAAHIAGLTEAEQAKLHAAAHFGY
jgi:hypothetical protein